jgi:hypothetical protein
MKDCFRVEPIGISAKPLDIAIQFHVSDTNLTANGVPWRRRS